MFCLTCAACAQMMRTYFTGKPWIQFFPKSSQPCAGKTLAQTRSLGRCTSYAEHLVSWKSSCRPGYLKRGTCANDAGAQVDVRQREARLQLLKPSFTYGRGRPAYSLAQLFHFMRLSLGFQDCPCLVGRGWIVCQLVLTFCDRGLEVLVPVIQCLVAGSCSDGGSGLAHVSCQLGHSFLQRFKPGPIRGIKLKNAAQFKLTMLTALQLADGSLLGLTSESEEAGGFAEGCVAGSGSGSGPSPAAMSMSRYKLDIALMAMRRRFWQMKGFSSRWISLSYDSSPQKKELLITEEYTVLQPGQCRRLG